MSNIEIYIFRLDLNELHDNNNDDIDLTELHKKKNNSNRFIVSSTVLHQQYPHITSP